MRWLTDLVFFGREGWMNFTRSRLLTVFSIMIIAISLAIITVFSTVFFNIDQYLKRLEQRPVYSIFLSRDVTEKEVTDLAAYLETISGVTELHIVTPEEGIARLAERFPLASRIKRTLEDNPLPFTIRLRIQAGALTRVKSILAENSIVETLYSPNFFLEQMKSLTAAITAFIALIAAILVLASVFTIYNVIRINILARKTDIEIMQLVGADMLYVRTPFAVEGFLQGFLGGLAGALTGQALVLLVRTRYLDHFAYLPFLSRLDSLPSGHLLALVLLSITFGLFGSILAAMRVDYV